MMRINILQAAQADLEQRRLHNSLEGQRRRAEAEARSPELARALIARQELIYGSMRGILAGRGAYEDLPARMEVMNQRVGELLVQCGYPVDWLEPVYSCAKCRDTGYVGETIREMCDCLRSAYYARLYREVGLGDRAEQSFERFDLSVFPDTVIPEVGKTQRAQMKFIRKQCEDWVHRYPDANVRTMVLSGKSGLGKTYLMHAMAKVLLDKGFNVLLISAYRFMELARKAHIENQIEGMENLIEADVLMLDDLGSEPLMENITIVQLFNLLNERQLAGRATVISTNLNKKELREQYTERVTSRLLDKNTCVFIPFLGDDIRRQ